MQRRDDPRQWEAAQQERHAAHAERGVQPEQGPVEAARRAANRAQRAVVVPGKSSLFPPLPSCKRPAAMFLLVCFSIAKPTAGVMHPFLPQVYVLSGRMFKQWL